MPLIDHLIVPDGPSSMDLSDPAVLYLLARQQFGGLSAVTPSALSAFAVAQAKLDVQLSMERCTDIGPADAFNLAVESVVGDRDVLYAFAALYPMPVIVAEQVEHSLRVADVTQHLMRKMFNTSCNAYCKRVNAVNKSGGGKQGVGVRVEMKVLQWQQDGVWVCQPCHAMWNVRAPTDAETSEGVLGIEF